VRVHKIDIEEIDKEIAQLDEKLKEYQAISQRRSDLLNIKVLAERVWGPIEGTYPAPPVATNGHGIRHDGTISGTAFRVLATKGPMNISDLLKGMREAGWIASGDDAKDKRNLYSAIYKKPQFKLEDGVWDVTDVK
jgi:hypothetical protein